MSVTAPEQDHVPTPAEREPAALFRYSTWLHVGVGAEDCPEVDEAEGRNGCGDRGHFHAWCRLPNPLQHAEIRDRALAAKARKIRQLRDPESDASAILEEEFDAKRRAGDSVRDSMIDELLAIDYFRDYYAAMQEVAQVEDPHADVEDPDPPKLYRHVDDDQRRMSRLEAMAEEQRPKDEYEELRKHLAAYQEAIEQAMKLRTEPKRSALGQLSNEQLIDQLRDRRIEAEALREFSNVYSVHEWLSCAYRQPDGSPVLADLELLENAAPEVISGLQSAFADLKRTAQEAQGN